MSQRQYNDLTDQEVYQISTSLLHTVTEEKDLAEEFNTSARAVRRIAGALRIDSEKREQAIDLRKQYLVLFEEGSLIRHQAEALFRESVGPGLRKFWVEDQNLVDADKCPACRDDQRPCKCGLL